ncbi:MAG: zf-HC2 domain-containing protein [Candidatus Solibacter usitatus]|nr:zf-HC2 domain-containing protein [Candidatus Solibacter usitatus]
MTCPEFDWKGFVLDEAPAPERRRMEEHLASCAACREETESLRLTLTAMRRLPAREIPRRISFVSDPVFEPSWWQRFWSSAPRLGFASAAMLSVAILAHGVATRGGAGAPQGAPQGAAQVEAQVQAEVDKRLSSTVEQKLQAQLKPAMNDLAARIQEFEKRAGEQREADLRDVKSAFTLLDKRVSNVYLTAARYGGD